MIFSAEGKNMPKREDRFEEIRSHIGAVDEEGAPRAVSCKVEYVSKGNRFMILDFGQGVYGWLSGCQSATGEREKGFIRAGDLVDVEVLSFDSETKRFVCARKDRVRRIHEAMKESVRKGDILEARVVRGTKYGYFVDIGGGNTVLLHNSMIARSLGDEKPSFVKDQFIRVMVTGFSRAYDSFTVSYRDVRPDHGIAIGNVFAVQLEEETVSGFSCHLCLYPEMHGSVSGKKQNARYRSGEIRRAIITGFENGGLSLAFI